MTDCFRLRFERFLLKCLEEYNIVKETNIIYRLLFADDKVIIKQDKDEDIYEKINS